MFATVLDGKKIKARKRLFMTATPRYFKEHVKRRAAELEYELVSMDDQHVFGPEFHVLTFHEAISADPPLLTDYQVVVIGVTDREAKAWAEEARLVRTAEGLDTDARTLAAQIGLAKAMKKYDLRKLITFHSSVAKAARFVDRRAARFLAWSDPAPDAIGPALGKTLDETHLGAYARRPTSHVAERTGQPAGGHARHPLQLRLPGRRGRCSGARWRGVH